MHAKNMRCTVTYHTTKVALVVVKRAHFTFAVGYALTFTPNFSQFFSQNYYQAVSSPNNVSDLFMGRKNRRYVKHCFLQQKGHRQ